jgi:hypothetical protein
MLVIIISILVIVIVKWPSEFLKNSDPGGYAVVFLISKKSDKANDFNMRLRDLGGVTSAERFFMFSENSDHIFSRIYRYSDSEINVSELLVVIDDIIDELQMSDFVEYAVIDENGLAQATSGFNPHQFP